MGFSKKEAFIQIRLVINPRETTKRFYVVLQLPFCLIMIRKTICVILMIVFLENKGYICVFIRGQCDSLKSSASTETTGIETPELSMVLEKASGK